MKNINDKTTSKSPIFKYIINRYVLFTLVFFLLIGIPATIYFSNFVTRLFIETFEDSAVTFVEASVESILDGKRIDKPLSGNKFKELDIFVDELKKHIYFQEINIWALDGTLVYSSDKDAPVGEKREISGDFARARNNKRNSEIEIVSRKELQGGTEKEEVLEVYFPVHDSNNKVVNVLEIYAPLEPIQKIVSRARTSISIFFITLFFVVVVIGQTGAVIMTRKDESYMKEKNISHSLQDALTIMPSVIPGVALAYDYHSATEAARVGGDFYDVFSLDDDRTCFVVGDVSGSGLYAAIVAAEVKSTLRAYSMESDSPAEIVKKTNDLVNKISEISMMTTLFFGILDMRLSKYRFCSAGHPPVMLKRIGQDNQYLSTFDMPVGTLADIDYKQDEVSLEINDILLFYTDGIIEARRGVELYGDARLSKLFKSADTTSPKVIVDLIFDDVLKFSGSELADDAALMVVKFVGHK